ncbi:MAG: hypothetical protein NT085_02485 [candidate division SR1 bacterium]|nr:hypothetical protein [candidate division SR1 bacterium]
MLQALINFYQNYTVIFWIIVVIIVVVLVVIFFIVPSEIRAEQEENRQIAEHNNNVRKKISEQLSDIGSWTGKMINILSSNIAESCRMQEVIPYEDSVKIVLQGHQEFIVMSLPYVTDGKTIKARGKVINPNEQPVKTDSTLHSVKEFVASPVGLGVGATIIGNVAPFLAGPFAMTWVGLQSGPDEESFVEFTFVE